MDEVVVTGYSRKKDIAPESTSVKPPESISLSKYKKQILKSIDFSKFENLEGKYRIKISFTVFENGSLSNFNLKNSPNKELSDEIIRIIKSLGPWIPAMYDGNPKAATTSFTLKIEIE